MSGSQPPLLKPPPPPPPPREWSWLLRVADMVELALNRSRNPGLTDRFRWVLFGSVPPFLFMWVVLTLLLRRTFFLGEVLRFAQSLEIRTAGNSDWRFGPNPFELPFNWYYAFESLAEAMLSIWFLILPAYLLVVLSRSREMLVTYVDQRHAERLAAYQRSVKAAEQLRQRAAEAAAQEFERQQQAHARQQAAYTAGLDRLAELEAGILNALAVRRLDNYGGDPEEPYRLVREDLKRSSARDLVLLHQSSNPDVLRVLGDRSWMPPRPGTSSFNSPPNEATERQRAEMAARVNARRKL